MKIWVRDIFFSLVGIIISPIVLLIELLKWIKNKIKNG